MHFRQINRHTHFCILWNVSPTYLSDGVCLHAPVCLELDKRVPGGTDAYKYRITVNWNFKMYMNIYKMQMIYVNQCVWVDLSLSSDTHELLRTRSRQISDVLFICGETIYKKKDILFGYFMSFVIVSVYVRGQFDWNLQTEKQYIIKCCALCNSIWLQRQVNKYACLWYS